MRDKRRERFDYSPCPNAKSAITEAMAELPGASRQAVMDVLCVYGRWAMRALKDRPTELRTHRNYWRPDPPASSK